MATTKKTATKKVAKTAAKKAVKKTAAPAKKPKAPAKPRAPRKPKGPVQVLDTTAVADDALLPPHATATYSADELAAAAATIDPAPVAFHLNGQVEFSDGTRSVLAETPAAEGVWARFKRWLKS